MWHTAPPLAWLTSPTLHSTHRRCEAWLAKFDAERSRAWPVLVSTYGGEQALKWLVNWRLFFLACSELFAYGRGQEWFVSHYLFTKPTLAAPAAGGAKAAPARSK